MTAFLAILMASASHASESFPFDHAFGTTTSTGCSAAWNGSCEVGITGFGDNNSLEAVTHTADSDASGVSVKPGASSPNGLKVTMDTSTLSTNDRVKATAFVTMLGGTADLGIRAIFKNSTGQTISTQTRTFEAMEGMSSVEVDFTNPANSATAVFKFGATDASSGSVRMILGLKNDPQATQSEGGGCHGGGHGGGITITHPAGECSVSCDDWECNVSCPTGTEPYEVCSVDESICALITSCYCIDGNDLDAQEYMDPVNY